MQENQPFELYRYYHSDGTSKDWAIRYNGDGTFTRRYGKTGSRLAETTTPYSGRSAFYHLKLVREKTDKGYQHLGLFDIDDNGKISAMPHEPPLHEVSPVVLEPRIYWRIKIQNAVLASPELPFLKGKSAGFSVRILQEFPDCSWLKNIAEGHGDFIQTGAGFLTKENGVGSLLLLMVLRKHAPDGIAITMSHEDGVEISDHVNFETEALSFFDSNLESIRPLAEDLELIVKRIDLSTIKSSYGDYFF